MSKSKNDAKPGNVDVTIPETGLTEETVTLTVTLPRVVVVPLLKELGVNVERDLAVFADKPLALKHILSYGVGRFNRDGASPGEYCNEEGTFAKVAGDGFRKATIEERGAEALRLSNAKWSGLLAGTLRQRIGGATADGMLIQECRVLVVKALVKRGVARKAIPKLDTLAAMERVCRPFAADGLWTRIVAQAQRVVALRETDDI